MNGGGTAGRPDTGHHTGQPDWGLCVATYERIEALALCVGCALRQTLPPSEIVIVDGSEGWAANAARIEAIVAEHAAQQGTGGGPAVRLVHEQAEQRSSATQRNQAAARARADVLFMIDDDSLLYPDCAETIMRIYAADAGEEIAAVAASHRAAPPGDTVVTVERKVTGLDQAQGTAAKPGGRNVRSSAVSRFLMREVMLMAAEKRFIRYDHPDRPMTPVDFDAARFPGAHFANYISGHSLTVRRSVALREPFDDGLVGYAAGEDLDASYRYGRHGWIVSAQGAFLHHIGAASGRQKRKMVTAFGLMNVAYMLRKNSTRPGPDFARFFVMWLRMLPAEVLKDLASRRWTMPQAAGVLMAMRYIPRILAKSPGTVQPWYEDLQRRILAAHRPPAPAKPQATDSRPEPES